MAKIFGIPVLISIILGILFPYTAIEFKEYGFIFLFLLMVLAGLNINYATLGTATKRIPENLLALFFLFVFFPLIQWFLANLIIEDKQLLLGLLFASLTPTAIVAPYFVKLIGGDEEFSLLFLSISMLICPIFAPLAIRLLLASDIPSLPIFFYTVLLVTIPLIVSFLIKEYFSTLNSFLNKHITVLNILFLSLLIYILFGSASTRINLNYENFSVISKLLALVFFQDFGILLLAFCLMHFLFSAKMRNTLVILLSMKNVAIAAGTLLFFDPKAAFPAALGFIAHACLFSFIPICAKLFQNSKLTLQNRNHREERDLENIN